MTEVAILSVEVRENDVLITDGAYRGYFLHEFLNEVVGYSVPFKTSILLAVNNSEDTAGLRLHTGGDDEF